MENYISKQISDSATIILNGPVEEIFPLFSAIEEKKWVPGWHPVFIFPETGEFQENQVFRTKSSNHFENEFTWICSYLNRESHSVSYTIYTENRIWTVKVKCSEQNEQTTQATITYTYTGLNELGDSINEEALEHMYHHRLKDWESAMNYFLKTGKMIEY